ncbi:MAG: Gfo/Idh/MocA family oxidoreductase [Gemmatimonadota bacterium]|nr:Gfo/Idh/MocA family oxidoreductase [Gemmatimonadota bacterium]
MTLGVGVIGFGVMGRTHAAAYQAAERAGLAVRLEAICSRQVAGVDAGGVGNLTELAAGDIAVELAGLRAFRSAEAMLADARIDAVSITTWTESHVPLALAALAAGKHVLVEKPVALSTLEVERLAAAVPDGLVCMPAFCMRFWPGWPWLRDTIRNGSLGALQSLQLSRLGEPPGWAQAFYRDLERSGGALFDLHIHDVDFVRWCLGDPASLASTGSRSHVTTRYQFPDGPAEVVAEGGHLAQPGFGFHMKYRAVFEDAVADFHHSRESPVLLTRDGATTPVALPAGTAYEAQARHFIEQCLGLGSEPLRATMADAVAATRLLEREAEMVEAGNGE